MDLLTITTEKHDKVARMLRATIKYVRLGAALLLVFA